MVAAPFAPPAIPWLEPKPLSELLDLGPGLDRALLHHRLSGLCGEPFVRAVVAFGSRGRGDARSDSDLDLAVICREPTLPAALKAERWQHCRRQIGTLGHGLDLVVVGAADAERLSQSRWHVMGDVAREGLVLYVAG